MSYSAYVSCTPFRLVEPVDTSRQEIERIMTSTLDDYVIDLVDDLNGAVTLVMDVQDVGDSLSERLDNLCAAVQPWLATPFELMLRNCDTASDDRDSFHYGGPSDAAIEAFKRRCAIERATEALQCAPGVADLLAALANRKMESVSRSPTRFEIHEEIKSCGYTIKKSGEADGNFIWWHEASDTSSKETFSLREEAAQAAYAAIQSDRVRLSLRLDVLYQCNGEKRADIERLLNNLVQRAAGEGSMTGHLASEVVEWSSHVGDLPLTPGPVEVDAAAAALEIPAEGATMWDVAQLLGQFPDDFSPSQRQDAPPQQREDAVPPKVVIILDGGVLQEVVADVPIQATLVDYDTDGAEPGEVVHLTRHQEDGSDTAVVKPVTVHVLPERSQQIHEASDTATANRNRSAQRGG